MSIIIDKSKSVLNLESKVTADGKVVKAIYYRRQNNIPTYKGVLLWRPATKSDFLDPKKIYATKFSDNEYTIIGLPGSQQNITVRKNHKWSDIYIGHHDLFAIDPDNPYVTPFGFSQYRVFKL